MNMLDPARIAAFFTLPGAVELVEAFSSIPPGPVRDSIVAHAQALAVASGWPASHAASVQQPIYQPAPRAEPMIAWVGKKPIAAPAAQANGQDADGVVWRNGRPGKMIRQPAYDQRGRDGKVKRMPASERFFPFPSGQVPDTDDGMVSASGEGQIVERVLQGSTPKAVAQSLGLDVEVVYKLMDRARKAGVVFPRDGDKRVKTNRSKASPFMRRVLTRLPTPPQPWWWEDPDSPIWDNGDLLPTGMMAEKSFALIGPQTTQNFKTMTATASRQGITLRRYVALRAEVVRRAKEGQAPTRIAHDLRQPEFRIYGVLSQVGYSATDAAAEHQRPIVGNVYGSPA